MENQFISQTDIPAEAFAFLTTPLQHSPKTITTIVLPAVNPEVGWVECEFYLMDKSAETNSEFELGEPITKKVIGVDKIYLEKNKILLKPSFKVNEFNWIFAVRCVNSSNEELFLTGVFGLT